MNGKCTVYFDDPFWVGVFERNDENGLSLARYVFGGEPGDAALLLFCKTEFANLVFTTTDLQFLPTEKPSNYKRRQREVRKQLQQTGAGTFAQRAMQAQYEASKQEKKHESSQKREEESRAAFFKKQAKKKQKKQGR